jgi:hypothetical protein
MSLHALPHADPGVPDTRSGFRFLLWLEQRQIAGQVTAALWGTLHMAAVACFPAAVGIAVQAVVDRPGGRLMLAGGLILVHGGATAFGVTMPHREGQSSGATGPTGPTELTLRGSRCR